MAWLFPLILLFIAYGAYKAIELTSPKRRIQRLEAKANKIYNAVKRQLEKDIAEQTPQRNNGNQRLPTEDDTEASLQDLKEYLQHIKSVEQKFLRLKQRYEAMPVKHQLEIYQAWYEYNVTLSSIENEQKGVRYMFTPKDYVDTLKALATKREAIERTFDRKLKA